MQDNLCSYATITASTQTNITYNLGLGTTIYSLNSFTLNTTASCSISYSVIVASDPTIALSSNESVHSIVYFT